jgi:hypothetical protein
VLSDLLIKKVVVLVNEENEPVDVLTIIDALDYMAMPGEV